MELYRALAVEANGLDSRQVAFASQMGSFPGPMFDEPDHIDARLRAMDEAGVERQVLSLASLFPYFEQECHSVRTARAANESLAAIVESRPDRFSMFLALPLPHVEAAVDEIEHWRGRSGVTGAQLGTSVLGRSAAAAEFDPVFAALERVSPVAFYHPTGNGIESPLVNESGLEVSVGTSFEDTVLAIQLALAGVPSRFPKLDHIVPHFGGMVSLLLERLDNQGSTLRPVLTEPLSATLKRFYYDTVSHGSHAALRAACTAVGHDRIVPGSDYPILQLFEPYADSFDWILESGIDGTIIESILHHNAHQLINVASSSEA